MLKKMTVLSLFLAMFTIACGSMNRIAPSNMDAKAMEADVRSKIAEVVPEKTFAIEVNVDDHAIVTLEGHAANREDIVKMVDAAKSVSGVKRVINHIHVQ